MLSDWTAAGEREVNINYDIEDNPLQIRTDSLVGSEDLIRVHFRAENGTGAGGVRVKFTDPPQYHITWCSSHWENFTAPEEQLRTWTITVSDSSVILTCNGVEIVNYLFSESTRDDCVSHWNRDVVKMKFMSNNDGTDTASDEYRAKPIGKHANMGTLYLSHLTQCM